MKSYGEIEYVNYKESFGPLHFQEGFEDEVIGKTLEEQIRCYAWTTAYELCKIPYKEVEDVILKSEYYRSTIEPITQKSLIKKDDIIVGIAIKNYSADELLSFNHSGILSYEYEYILPYKGYCYDVTSDNNGAGYKEREWYKYLICLPWNHGLW